MLFNKGFPCSHQRTAGDINGQISMDAAMLLFYWSVYESSPSSNTLSVTLDRNQFNSFPENGADLVMGMRAGQETDICLDWT